MSDAAQTATQEGPGDRASPPSSLRFAFLAAHDPADERWLFEAARALCARGHDVQLLCGHDDGGLAARAAESGVTAHAVVRRGLLAPLGRARLHGALRALRPHVLVAFDAASLRSVSPAAAGVATFARFLHVAATPAGNERFEAGAWIRDGAVGDATHAFPVPFGVAFETPPLASTRTQLRRQLRLPARARLFMLVGDLVPGAGHATALHALAALRGRGDGPLPTLGFVGTGPEESDLHVLAHDLGVKDHVLWIGFRKDVKRYLGAADALVLAADTADRWSWLDAMACGVPVVAADGAARGDLVRDGDTGLCVRAGDAESLAVAFARLVRDPDAAARMGAAAHAAVAARASSRRLATALEAITYAGLLARRPAAAGRRAALFVDRDGTLMRNVPYNVDPAAVVLEPDVGLALRWVRNAGLTVVVATNQSAVARGFADAAAVDAVHARLREWLRTQGADFDAIYFCPHHPDHGPACDCRKPQPGLLLRAAREHGLDLGRSVTVGDAERDLEAGRRAGTAVVAYAGGSAPAAGIDAAPGADFAAGTPVVGDWVSVARDVLALAWERGIRP